MTADPKEPVEPEARESEEAYYRRRAEEELERAQAAIIPEAVAVHCQLAEHYLVHAERLASGDLLSVPGPDQTGDPSR